MAAAPQSLFAEAELGATKAKILEAAFRRLAREGYAALSVREIARDAGVNHALINYHFRSKDQLVIEVLDAANRELLARQQSMYGAPGGFAEKWAQARAFYEGDLASGFVRMQAELWAASLSNPGLREKFLPRLLAWRDVVLGAVREALAALEASGPKLPPPFTAETIATRISEFWLGMEFVDLIGRREERAEHHVAPGEQARQELLAQPRVRQARRPQLGLHAHEAGREVALVEGARLRPFLREAAGRAVHALLAREQLSVRRVQHLDDQLVLGAEVVIDERVVHARVAGDLAHAERGVTLPRQPPEGGLENLRLGGAALGLGEQRLGGSSHCPDGLNSRSNHTATMDGCQARVRPAGRCSGWRGTGSPDRKRA